MDHNQETRREIESLLILDNFKELTKRFKRRLKINVPPFEPFGFIPPVEDETFIKCKIGAGFTKINPITLQQVGHGLVDFILNYQPKEEDLFLKEETIRSMRDEPTVIQELLANKGIVMGYDQNPRSCTIAKILAAVLKKFGGV